MFDWFSLSLIAAFFLGLYGIAKKRAVHNNAVAPVLLLNVCTAALIWSGPLLWELFTTNGNSASSSLWSPEPIDHLKLFLKSVIVGTSWMLAFEALKHLPISIASPIRATSPLWTILWAVTFLQERPTAVQWSGMALILISFLAFSVVGKKEGVSFHKNRAVLLMIAATLVSSFSGLYDKYLLQTCEMHPRIVQAWFSVYLVPVMIPMFLWWVAFDRKHTPFIWRWTIPLIAILLLIADYLYFVAVSDPEALISVISPLRRCSLVIPFLYGVMMLKEKSWKAKLACIAILLLGVFFISFG